MPKEWDLKIKFKKKVVAVVELRVEMICYIIYNCVVREKYTKKAFAPQNNTNFSDFFMFKLINLYLFFCSFNVIFQAQVQS